MEERCPMCPNQCFKFELKCGRGKHYFSDQNHQQNNFEQKNDLTDHFIKASQIFNHKTEMKKEREKILDILYQNEDISQKELLDQLDINDKTLERFLFRFEKEDLINNYHHSLALTSKGKEIVKDKKTNDEDLFDMLDQKEKDELKELLEKVLRSWHEQYMKFHSLK